MKPKFIPPQFKGDPSGPLSSYMEHYLTVINGQGYAPSSVNEQLHLLDDFGRWLVRAGREVRDLNEAVTEQFLRYERTNRRSRLCAPAALRRLLAMLREIGAVPAAEVLRLSPSHELTFAYERFLLEERHLSRPSVCALRITVSRFLAEKFGDGPLDLSGLEAPDVTGFVQRHVRRHGSSHARKLVVAMRSFLRYLHYKGLVRRDLSWAVPKVARWSLSTLPKHLPAAQVRRVLSGCERRTPRGRRNYAILLLLARLGLRAGEVVGLSLEDVDWDHGRITVCGKGRRDQLPLPTDVARAIAEYLRRDRPRCASRRVFIRAYAPHTGFGRAIAIAKIVKCALAKAGVESARKGAHLLRHSLATDMLRKGASLDEIGEVLRHKSPDTTAIYAKVDLKSLKTLAMRWPGGAR